MSQFAFLCGAAKEGFQQKKFSQMYERLITDEWLEREITLFPNGVDEILLEYAITNCITELKAKQIILYICTTSETTSEDIIRKSVIDKYEDMADKDGIDMRVVYDFDDEMVCEDALGWERIG